jgi:hypothetical protein
MNQISWLERTTKIKEAFAEGTENRAYRPFYFPSKQNSFLSGKQIPSNKRLDILKISEKS